MSLSISFIKNSFGSFFIGTSSFKVTNFLLSKALSLLAIKVSLLLFCLISDALSSRVSKSLYLLISSAAVLTPIPGTPGILSDESPASDWTSITCSGFTPNFSSTSFSPITLLFIGSNNLIFVETNCIKSLSDEITVTFAPAAIIFFEYVAIKSSAS